MIVDTSLLHSVLDARERRYLARQELARSSLPGVLVEVALNIPGWPKSGAAFARVFRAGVRGVSAVLGHGPAYQRFDAAGYYALFNSGIPALHVKRAMCRLEEQAPWGRLLDIDCHGPEGKVTREAAGAPPRRCFLCAAPHESCIQARRHSLEALRAEAVRLASACPEEAAPC